MVQPHSNTITLDQHGTGSLLLREIRTPCLFKIKTNVPNAVETKPAYGIIQEEGVEGRKIAVRYKGNITDVQKVAVKVCMLPITAEQVNIDYSQILGKYKEIKQSGKSKEVHLLFQCSFRSEQQSQMRQFRFKKQDFIKNNRKTIEIKTSRQQEKIQNRQKFQKSIEKQQQNIAENLSTYNCNTLIAFIITLAFLIGVVIGVKSSPYLSYLRFFVARNV